MSGYKKVVEPVNCPWCRAHMEYGKVPGKIGLYAAFCVRCGAMSPPVGDKKKVYKVAMKRKIYDED